MHTSASLVGPVDSPRFKILFLGYSKEETILIRELINCGCEVWHTSDEIETTQGYDLVISYGYRHILKKSVIESSLAPILNLHISYLPWNRGAHPNFWSFYDRTPSGVTIHTVDQGLDTGPIICQRIVDFRSEEDTFSKTYIRLNSEIEQLFIDNLENILAQKFSATPQCSDGTYHNSVDLPSEFSGWNSNIEVEIMRLAKILNPK